MALIAFVLATSWKSVVVAAGAAVVNGLSTVAILAVVAAVLTSGGHPGPELALTFAGLCVVVLATRTGSRLLSTYISGMAVHDLRLRLAEQVLRAPLRRIEEAGVPRVLAILTADVTAVADALPGLAILCANLTLFAGALAYLAWLSRPGFILALAVVAVGLPGYRLLQRRGREALVRAREHWNALYKSFEALTHGIKELKLNARRRHSFLTTGMVPTVEGLRRTALLGWTLHVAAAAWRPRLRCRARN